MGVKMLNVGVSVCLSACMHTCMHACMHGPGRREGQGAKTQPAPESQMVERLCLQPTPAGPFGWPGVGGNGGGKKIKKNQGSVGRERPGSGADAERTMGLLKEGVLEGVWRALCIASSALQVVIGQLHFNEVHSKVCSSVGEPGALGLNRGLGAGEGRERAK